MAQPFKESANPVRLPATQKKVIYDEVNPTLAYLGVAPPDAGTDESVWMIQRIITGPGNSIAISFADGNAEFDNIWDSRNVLIYP